MPHAIPQVISTGSLPGSHHRPHCANGETEAREGKGHAQEQRGKMGLEWESARTHVPSRPPPLEISCRSCSGWCLLAALSSRQRAVVEAQLGGTSPPNYLKGITGPLGCLFWGRNSLLGSCSSYSHQQGACVPTASPPPMECYLYFAVNMIDETYPSFKKIVFPLESNIFIKHIWETTGSAINCWAPCAWNRVPPVGAPRISVE